MWCSSEMRCFRYVGTLTACHVATSLVRVMLTLSEERETARCQDAAEARKKGGKASIRSLCTSCLDPPLSPFLPCCQSGHRASSGHLLGSRQVNECGVDKGCE